MASIPAMLRRLLGKRPVPQTQATAPTPSNLVIPPSYIPPAQPAQPRELTEEECYALIREPKAQKVVQYTPEIIAKVIGQLRNLGFEVRDIEVDAEEYRRYFAKAGYPTRFPNYYSFNLPEKSLEHYMAAKLLDLRPDDVYIDIASEHSPVPQIYAEQFGCTTYRQDLAYPAGLLGDQIGGDAAAMPVPDGFASKMALHCSFEHFEGDADMRFIREVGRVLRSGGRVCFAPIYLFEEFVNQAGVIAAHKTKVEFDAGATVYAKPGWRHNFARYYDPAHLAGRIRANADGLDLTVYNVTNARTIDPSCYLRFILLASKP